MYSKDFKACPRAGEEEGRHPSGESEERILIRDRGRIPQSPPPKQTSQRVKPSYNPIEKPRDNDIARYLRLSAEAFLKRF